MTLKIVPSYRNPPQQCEVSPFTSFAFVVRTKVVKSIQVIKKEQ